MTRSLNIPFIWRFSVAQVYNALSQLECDSEVWEDILSQSFELLSDLNEESLVAAIHFTFKTASQCQHLPEAVSIHVSIFILCLELIFSKLRLT